MIEKEWRKQEQKLAEKPKTSPPPHPPLKNS